MYTYDDFVTAARNAGMLDRFSEEDLRIAQSSPEYGLSALKLNQDLQNATTMEQQLLAQEAMKQLRQSYGVTGMQSSQPGTQTVYQQALNEASPAAGPTGSFLYDPATDPSYGAQKKAYLREGDRARADTMAQVSAATGGVPSSYAVTAAQQAGDYYSTQWADKVPGLEQTAYQKYLKELGIQKEAADLMAAKGDYSLLGKYYGLTDEQLALLQKRSGGKGPDYSYLKLMFPEGIIDADSWDYLINQGGLTADQLANMGYKLYIEDPEDNTVPSGPANNGAIRTHAYPW